MKAGGLLLIRKKNIFTVGVKFCLFFFVLESLDQFHFNAKCTFNKKKTLGIIYRLKMLANKR